MPFEEEPQPSNFAAYPRPEKIQRKDPDPIPSDRWLARVGGVLCFSGFVSSTLARSSGSIDLWVYGAAAMVVMLTAFFVAGRGYRVGFGIVMVLGLFQIWGLYLQWSHGSLFRGSWLMHFVNFYTAFFAAYCAARYFGLWPRRPRGVG